MNGNNNNKYKTTSLGNDNYIVITGWMINEYKLTGNELITYALIYGMSQYGKKNGFFGSINTIQKWLGIKSDKTVRLILKSLLDKKLITRSSLKVNGQESYIYFSAKYNDGSLEKESDLKNYSDLIVAYAEKKGLEYKALKKELIIKDYIDLETLEINDAKKDLFKSEYPELYESYFINEINEKECISGENESSESIKNYEKITNYNDNTEGAVKITELYKNRTIQNTSPVKITEGSGKNYRGGAVKITDNNTKNTNLNNTAASNNDLNPKTDVNTIQNPAAEDLIKKLKEHIADSFLVETCNLVFNDSFYSEIINQCKTYALSEKELLEYIDWAVAETKSKPRDDVFNYFYKTASKNYFVAKYINHKLEETKNTDSASLQSKVNYVKCPVCGVLHDSNHDCPNCQLPENCLNNRDEINNFKIRFSLKKPEKKKLDLELEQHEKQRPEDLFDIQKYKIWKDTRNKIFEKYKEI